MAVADSAAGLGAWAEVDWRFMLPDPRLGPVWLAAECAAESTVLGAVGVEVVADPGAAAVAFVDGSRCDFHEAERTLAPGALVRISVAAPRGRRSSNRERGWGIADQLTGRRWQVLGRIWAAGGIKAPSAYIDLDDRHAVVYWWRMPTPRGVRARLAVTLRVTLVRCGLSRLVCREGYVFARTPR
jgi:hypothetical protein